MAIDPTRTISSFAAETPATTRVFERFGIDYCCGGNRSLLDACAESDVSLEELSRLVEEVQAGRVAGDATDWSSRRLSDLIEHIIATHHAYLRTELPEVSRLLIKVGEKHGQNHREVLRVYSTFEDMRDELVAHMHKEEQVLFPYIARLERAQQSAAPLPQAPFGSVQFPIRMMTMEHESAGQALRAIRSDTHNFTPPPDACTTFRAVYSALETLERDLHQHIHLENNVLFPRAVELEERFAGVESV